LSLTIVILHRVQTRVEMCAISIGASSVQSIKYDPKKFYSVGPSVFADVMYAIG